MRALAVVLTPACAESSTAHPHNSKNWLDASDLRIIVKRIMDAAQLRRMFPNATASTIRANASSFHDTRTSAKLERHPRPESLEANQTQKGIAGCVHLSFVSVRKRLCDPDNLSCKWTLDALRYAGIIRGDEPDKITLTVSQRKAAKGEQEHTEVTLTFPDFVLAD